MIWQRVAQFVAGMVVWLGFGLILRPKTGKIGST